MLALRLCNKVKQIWLTLSYFRIGVNIRSGTMQSDDDGLIRQRFGAQKAG